MLWNEVNKHFNIKSIISWISKQDDNAQNHTQIWFLKNIVSSLFCSGFLKTEKQVYLIEPLEESVDGNHAIFKQEHLRVKQGTFGYVNDTVYDLGPRFSGLYKGKNMVITKILLLFV